MNQYGNQIQHYRKLLGLTFQELANRADTSRQQILRLEQGHRKLTREWAERLAPHLGVAAVDLMFLEKQSITDEGTVDRLPEQLQLIIDANASMRADLATVRKVLRRIEGRLEADDAIVRAVKDQLPSK